MNHKFPVFCCWRRIMSSVHAYIFDGCVLSSSSVTEIIRGVIILSWVFFLILAWCLCPLELSQTVNKIVETKTSPAKFTPLLYRDSEDREPEPLGSGLRGPGDKWLWKHGAGISPLKLLPGNKTLLVLTQGGIVTTGKLIFPVLCQVVGVIKPWTIVIESNPRENHHLISWVGLLVNVRKTLHKDILASFDVK